MSTIGLQRALGLSRYETAWMMIHTLRRAMVKPDRDKLSGEIDACWCRTVVLHFLYAYETSETYCY